MKCRNTPPLPHFKTATEVFSRLSFLHRRPVERHPAILPTWVVSSETFLLPLPFCFLSSCLFSVDYKLETEERESFHCGLRAAQISARPNNLQPGNSNNKNTQENHPHKQQTTTNTQTIPLKKSEE